YHCDHSPHIRPFFILMTPPPPRSTLFPYTTLFRSIVGTPGRLADHLRRGNIQSNTINTLVLDEYDKSVEWGFQEQIEEIVSKIRSEEHTSELQSRENLVCRLLLEKKKKTYNTINI